VTDEVGNFGVNVNFEEVVDDPKDFGDADDCSDAEIIGEDGVISGATDSGEARGFGITGAEVFDSRDETGLSKDLGDFRVSRIAEGLRDTVDLGSWDEIVDPKASEDFGGSDDLVALTDT